MSSPINPVISGLLQGFNLAHIIKTERMNQQALAQQQARDEENTQVRDLQTRMSLADRGYKPSSPDQDAEIATGQGIGPIQPPGGDGALVPGTTIQGPVPSDIKTRMANFKGQTYVRDPDAVIAAKQRRLQAQSLTDKLAEKQGEADILTRAKKDQAQNQFNTMGVPITDEMAKRAGLPPGTRIMQGPGFQGALGQLIRSNQPPTPKAGKSFLTREGGGNVTTVDADGTVHVSQPLGLPEPAKKGGELSTYQQTQIDRQKKLDADKELQAHVKAQKQAQKQVDDLEAQMQDYHEQNRQLGKKMIEIGQGKAYQTDAKGKPVKDVNGKPIKLGAEDLARYKEHLVDNQTKIKNLFDRQHSLIIQFGGGGSAPAAAAAPQGEAAPAGAAPQQTQQPAPGAKTAKVATSDQVNAYAKQKGITPAQAQQEFQQFGYAVQ